MGTQFEQAIDELFPQGSRGVFNVKFFRGHSREVTSEQLAEQLRSASTQIIDEKATRVTNIDGDMTF